MDKPLDRALVDNRILVEGSTIELPYMANGLLQHRPLPPFKILVLQLKKGLVLKTLTFLTAGWG